MRRVRLTEDEVLMLADAVSRYALHLQGVLTGERKTERDRLSYHACQTFGKKLVAMHIHKMGVTDD